MFDHRRFDPRAIQRLAMSSEEQNKDKPDTLANEVNRLASLVATLQARVAALEVTRVSPARPVATTDASGSNDLTLPAHIYKCSGPMELVSIQTPSGPVPDLAALYAAYPGLSPTLLKTADGVASNLPKDKS